MRTDTKRQTQEAVTLLRGTLKLSWINPVLSKTCPSFMPDAGGNVNTTTMCRPEIVHHQFRKRLQAYLWLDPQSGSAL